MVTLLHLVWLDRKRKNTHFKLSFPFTFLEKIQKMQATCVIQVKKIILDIWLPDI